MVAVERVAVERDLRCGEPLREETLAVARLSLWRHSLRREVVRGEVCYREGSP